MTEHRFLLVAIKNKITNKKANRASLFLFIANSVAK